MSYILEALKKSEQERQRGAAPSLRTTQAAVARPPRSAFWFSAVLALLLIGAGIAIGWWRPWQSHEPVAANESVAPTPTAESMVAQSREPNPPPIAPTPVPTPTIAIHPAAVPEVVYNAERGHVKAEAKATAHAPPAAVVQPAPVTPTAAAVAPIDALPEAPVVSLPAAAPVAAVTPAPARSSAPQQVTSPRRSDLPPAIRQEIPPLAISVHFYSSQRERSLVSINGRSLREGDEAAPDLKIEQITAEGVIFSYRGYRFLDAVQR